MDVLKKNIKSKEEKNFVETVGLKKNFLDEKRKNYIEYSKNKISKITKINNNWSKENNNNNIFVGEFKNINPQLSPKLKTKKPLINIINKLIEILDEKNLSNSYKKIIIKYFLSFCEFLDKKKKN